MKYNKNRFTNIDSITYYTIYRNIAIEKQKIQQTVKIVARFVI